MVFDVMIREKFNEAGKQVIIVYRMHDAVLSRCLQEAQNEGRYIISVIPLFRPKIKDVVLKYIEKGLTEEDLLPEDNKINTNGSLLREDIDSRLLKTVDYDHNG